jgi:hypothetical protein
MSVTRFTGSWAARARKPFAVQQLQQIATGRLAPGPNANDSNCSRPGSRHSRFLKRSPWLSATACNWFMIRVHACTRGPPHCVLLVNETKRLCSFVRKSPTKRSFIAMATPTKPNSRLGTYVAKIFKDESFRSYVPAPLPPDPPLDLQPPLLLLDQANQALGRLDGLV